MTTTTAVRRDPTRAPDVDLSKQKTEGSERKLPEEQELRQLAALMIRRRVARRANVVSVVALIGGLASIYFSFH